MLIRDRTRARVARDLLWHAVLGYVFDSIQRGDLAPLITIGLRRDQLQRLSSMSIGDLTEAMVSDDGVIQLRVDPDRLEALISTVERRRARNEVMTRCIQLGAPAAMMEKLFGLKDKEYRRRQVMNGVRNPVGRPPVASVDTAEAIYRAWEEQGERVSASALVQVAEQTGLPLHTIWRELSTHPRFSQQPTDGAIARDPLSAPAKEASQWTR